MITKIENKLKDIILSCGENLTMDASDIHEDTDLIEVFRYSSINIIQLIVEIETEFDIEFDDEYLEIEIISKYSNLLSIVSSKVLPN